MATYPITISVDVKVNEESFNRVTDQLEALQQLQPEQREAVGITGIAVAAMAAAGSTRRVSRRGLLGLGWLTR